jgi:dihydroorotase
MEFDLAKSGTIGLESAFGALMTVLPLEVIIEKLTAGKVIFNIEKQSIEENALVNFTLFSSEGNWTFGKENILSKSKNSAFLGAAMKGKVYGIINQGKLILN